MADFHFIRPLWLLMIVPAIALAIWLWRQKSQQASWRQAIAPALLEHLIEGSNQGLARWPWQLLLAGWLISCIALAGPAWQKLPQPVHQKQDALIIILDLSYSMYAEDISPSRLQRARHKVLDILKQRQEGLTALVAYSGDAHVVAPLTDDNDTIANLVPAMSPDMMPAYGSNPVAAFEQAQQLLEQTGISSARLLLITDDITDKNINQLSDQLGNNQLSILAIGTEQGAPIKGRDGFLKDNNGTIIMPKLHRQRLISLAQQTGGRFIDLQIDDRDIDYLLADKLLTSEQAYTQSSDRKRQFDQWQDSGRWLVWLLLPIALLAFRRGWLLALPVMISVQSNDSYALEWQDLWQTRDQQGLQALQQGNANTAAKLFENPDWQGSAHYQAGDYQAAAESFSNNDSANAHYNRGNALAKAGQLQEALGAYQQALTLNPELEDAQFNHQLVENLLQQQQQSQQNPSDNQPKDQNENDNSQQKNSQNQQGQQNQDQQNSDSQQSQNNQDQQNASQQQQEQQSQQQQEAEQKKQQQSAEQTKGEPDAPRQPQQAQQDQQADPEQQRQQQATEQWLRQIPDDPSGLLRNKFRYQYQQRQQQRAKRDEEQPLW
jgi:Ca-activated chloride channel family protein